MKYISIIIRPISKNISFDKIAAKNFVTVKRDAYLFEVLSRMQDKKASFAVVCLHEDATRITEVQGLITRQTIGDRVVDSAEFFRNDI